jgi:hypothetical protein
LTGSSSTAPDSREAIIHQRIDGLWSIEVGFLIFADEPLDASCLRAGLAMRRAAASDEPAGRVIGGNV